ncbi:MAG: DUF3199 family protein [Muribaculaceae bacterium]|nr:DUF3199 family protein [Muribaculaceae bacterium]
MATRPWIVPSDVTDYTQNPEVQARTPARLRMDISRAEARIIKYCGHDFSNFEAYPCIPEDVRTAAILVAEYYAAVSEAEASGRSLLKSETNDDYSYTNRDTESAIADLNLGDILDAYKSDPVRNGVRMDMHVC